MTNKKKTQLRRRIHQRVKNHIRWLTAKIGSIPALKELNNLYAGNDEAKKIIVRALRKQTRKRKIGNHAGKYAKCGLPISGRSVQGGAPGLGKRK